MKGVKQMKKITAIVMVMIVMTALLLPCVMAASPERSIEVIPTKDDLPEATADSPDFIFVMDESVVYVKYTDPNTGAVSYVSENELNSGYVVTPDQEWTKGSSDPAVFTSTADFVKFVDVYVDGALVAADNYDASEGSTIISFKPAYLETLEVAKHTVTVLSNDGSGSASLTIKTSSTAPGGKTTPQTGDDSNTGMWAAIALITLGAIGVVVLTLVKTRKSTEK